jgi:hypothetical protein
MWFFPLKVCSGFCLIGNKTQCVGNPVCAHNVETTAESIPPDTPITKDLIEFPVAYFFIQLDIFSDCFI